MHDIKKISRYYCISNVHAGEQIVHKRITSREHTLASRILNTRNPGRHVKMLIAMTDITSKWHHSRALKASNMAFLFATQITKHRVFRNRRKLML
jgi:hypothetical protein